MRYKMFLDLIRPDNFHMSFGGEEHFETLVFPGPSFGKGKPLKVVVQVINVLGKLVKSVPATNAFLLRNIPVCFTGGIIG